MPLLAVSFIAIEREGHCDVAVVASYYKLHNYGYFTSSATSSSTIAIAS